MYIVTSEEMRELDRHAIESLGIPSIALMENAGRAVAEEVVAFSKRAPVPDAGKPWLILVGKGNNGGDGMVCARHMQEFGMKAELLFASDPGHLTGDAALQYEAICNMGFVQTVYSPGNVQWHRYAGIVDALLGTGTKGAPRAPYAELIREANDSGLPIVAADIPSGLDADTGRIYDPCIRATITVALAFAKCGLRQYPGAEWAGQVITRKIGIPEYLAAQAGVQTFEANRRMFAERLGLTVPPVRPADSHKGTFGHVLVAAGCLQYSGAGVLATSAALRSGAGLVSWALPERLRDAMIGRVPEAMLLAVRDDGRGDWSVAAPHELLKLAEGKDSLVIGPGMGRFPGDSAWLGEIWSHAMCPLVLDADALNMLAEAGGPDALGPRSGRAPAVLTPHPGEMARLAGMTVREVQQDRIGLARRYATRHDVVLVLKGAGTVTATPDGSVYVNTSGNPGMATGGAGDVLAGIIAGLLAQGLAPGPAAALGVYLHGHAGDRAAAGRMAPNSIIAGDLVQNL